MNPLPSTAKNPSVEAEYFMGLALKLACRARERTWPNPMVGALVVKKNAILGTGYHHKAGEPHAEVLALDEAGAKARGSDLYVTLEPCHRTGRTGPCTQRIYSAKIKRVFVGAHDPNPRESGQGLRHLQHLGIEVISGVLRERCQQLNEVYNVFIREKRPFVVLKTACSLDGRIATRTGDARWISGMESRTEAHRYRALANAVLVGAGTVEQDDPQLDVRHVTGKNPAVVVLDSRLSISQRAKLLHLERKAPVWLYHLSSPTTQKRAQQLGKLPQVELVPTPHKGTRLDLEWVLKDLLKRGVYRLLVEGGSRVIGELVRLRSIDRLVLFIAPRLVGSDGVSLADLKGPKMMDQALRFVNGKFSCLGQDAVFIGRPDWPPYRS